MTVIIIIKHWIFKHAMLYNMAWYVFDTCCLIVHITNLHMLPIFILLWHIILTHDITYDTLCWHIIMRLPMTHYFVRRHWYLDDASGPAPAWAWFIAGLPYIHIYIYHVIILHSNAIIYYNMTYMCIDMGVYMYIYIYIYIYIYVLRTRARMGVRVLSAGVRALERLLYYY